MRKRPPILLLCLLQTFLAIAQTAIADSVAVDTVGLRRVSVGAAGSTVDNPLARYTVQSPQVAALMRYAEFPVSPATGILDISIPIYTIQTDGVTVPVSISYHASGIKVNDIATPVGLGWTLNAGGVIGCSTNGVRDNLAQSVIRTEAEFQQALTSGTVPCNSLHNIANGEGTVDTESDRYVYCFNGYTGCFRFDYTDMTPSPVPYEPVRIEKLPNGGFVITTSDGTVYTFSELEYTHSSQTHLSACHLTGIVTPNRRDTITFTYGKTSVYSQHLASEYQHSGIYYDWDEENVGNGIPYKPISGPICEYSISKAIVSYATPLLTTISWNGNRVEFAYKSDREEHNLQKERLSGITVLNSCGETVRYAELGNTSYLGSTKRSRRMLLKTISLCGNASGTDKETYSFTYNTGALPEYVDFNDLSTVRFHEDYWGYYNGTSSQHSVPKEYVADSKLAGADRTSDARYAQYGILTGITYPTGGTSTFRYEANEAANMQCGGLRIKEVTNSSEGKVQNREVFSYADGTAYLDITEDLFRYRTWYYYYRELYRHSTGAEWNSDEHTVSQGLPILSLTGWNNYPVFYDTVTRTYYDSCGSVSGNTVCHYIENRIANRCSGYDTNDYPRFYSELYNCETGCPSPLLASETHNRYAGGRYETDKTVSYSYGKVDKAEFPIGVRVYKNDVEVVYYTSQGGDSYVPYPSRAAFNAAFHGHNVYAFPSFMILTGKTVTDYTDGRHTGENYGYDTAWRSFLPISVTRACSDGKSLVANYTYPFNATALQHTTQATVDKLVLRHQYDVVLAEKTTKAGTVVSQAEYGHALSGDLLTNTSVSLSVGNNTLERRMVLTHFDKRGNVNGATVDGSHEYALLWGYNRQYPIALVDGVDFATLSQSLGSSLVSRLETTLSPSTADMQQVRSKAASLGGLCTTYTHKPLVGVVSATEPTGKTASYNYDTMGRLSSIKDTDGKTVADYAYHYNNDEASTYNYIQARRYLGAASSPAITETALYDGLGREVSRATTGMSPTGKVAQSYTEYDGMHRTTRTWLPAVFASLQNPLSASSVQLQAFATYSDSHPYANITYGEEHADTTTPPGDDWHNNGKASTHRRQLNEANTVKCYTASTASTASTSSLSASGYYPAGTLMEENATDEDGKEVHTFTDRQGNTILVRTGSPGDFCDTYFVYNDLCQLCFVLQPQYQKEADLNKYAFIYGYDRRGRVASKKQPGCAAVQYQYDKADRLTMEQDGMLKDKGLYRIRLYDRHDRPCLQGVCPSYNTAEALATVAFDAAQTGICGSGYTLAAGTAPSGAALETATYYDDYAFLGTSLFKGCAHADRLSKSNPANATGLQTGTVEKATGDGYLYQVSCYDQKGRETENRKSYPQGHLLTFTTQYSFTDKPLKETTLLTLQSGATHQSAINYAYNTHNDHVESTSLTCGGVSHNVGQYTYDDLGRVKSVARDGAGTTGYTYNVRSWLTGISGKWLTEKLHYTSNAAVPRYNGNIARQQWQVGGESILRGYDFMYDRHSRLVAAAYGEGASLTNNKDRYDEGVARYSANGAIVQLMRNGRHDNGSYGTIDYLTYTLDGNRPVKITDTATSPTYGGSFNFKDGADADTEYTYDANGNMTSDLNKGMMAAYDNLNHLSRITFGSGKSAEYNYAASGEKLRVAFNTVGTESTIDYIGPYILKDGKLDKYLFDGGYCTLSGGTPVFHFYSRDHLGNIRAVVSEAGTVEQTTHYYPFGGVYGDVAQSPDLQPYKYNGKELDRTHGLDWYDYGARMYDAAIGYWNSVDPLAEKYCAISPYTYCLNNPVNSFDPDGQGVWSKLAKGVFKIGKAVAKNGVKSLNQASTYYGIVSDVVEDYNTLTGKESSAWERFGAAASLASEILPVSVNDVMGVARQVHGNSKLSSKAQHAYDIIEKATGKIVKTGISSGKVRKRDGKSYRAESQVRKWNREEGGDIYESKITYTIPEGEGARDKALKYEKKRADELKERKELEISDKHKRP